ncbi:CHAP domain-containing protein [Sinimarinibacterium flocculans]|uniref:CHAP domain-containing protein n=1 Tax=Sinimarinibacterium flocculans TaxID=985250 RepID=UPI003512EFD6
MDAATAVNRALSALGKGTKYKSPGKMPPLEASSWPAGAKNDCSGFCCWVLRFSPDRKIKHPLYEEVNGGYFETTGLWTDGMKDTGYFSALDNPRPGAILVYPDYKDSTGKMRDGHMGVVVEVNPKAKGIAAVTRIVHCSSLNKGDAIQATDPKRWLARKESIIVWQEGMKPIT